MAEATKELEDIKCAAGSMLPEDRVARTMDLQEDIAAKVDEYIYIYHIYIYIYIYIYI